VNIIKGDLIKLAIEGQFDVIIHGCNCFCTMGAGIAKAIKSEFPEAYQVDLKSGYGNREKLGSYSSVTVNKNGREITVINAYTQFHWRGRGIKVDYDALKSVFQLVKKNYAGKRIGYPLIGAGLAGGDWNVISQIVDNELENENHALVQYAPYKAIKSDA
jgi:O-acetyl-ADP-ribose deacetylase (regulator of RNase III)